MLSLHELQQQFIQMLQHENAALLTLIKPTENLAPQEHLDIYRSSIIGALQKTLKEIFPVCLKLVGEEFFIGIANDYIQHTPSTAPDLASYGEKFPAFIKQFPPAQSLAYLGDVAELEWAWHQIFSAPNSTILDFKKLSLVADSENIIFLLPQNSYLLHSSFPIDQIWETNQEDYEGDPLVHLESGADYYFLVWRQAINMRIDNLSKVEWQMLKWIKDGLTIGDICYKAADILPNENIVELLPRLVEAGWLTDFIMGEPSNVL